MTPAGEGADSEQDARDAAYQMELRHAARGASVIGIMLAVGGALTAWLRGTYLPSIPKLVPLILIATALGLILIGMVRRVRYHLGRLRNLA